jgi:hypothetical protein
MANHGIFIGFGFPVHGREDAAARVFNEFVQYLAAQQQAGAIEGFEPAFLQPHGGDLGGFFLVRGDRQRLSELAGSAEFERQMTRAQLIVDHFGVVNCWLGEEIQRQMTIFQEATTDLT